MQGRNYMSCRCLVRCANIAPQTRQDKHWTTQGRTRDREGQRRGKRQQGWKRGAAARAQAGETAGVAHAEKDDNALGQRNVLRKPAQPDKEEKDQRKRDADATGATVEG